MCHGQVVNLIATVTLEILRLLLQHGIIQLEGNLSCPRTGLWMYGEQVPQQVCRLIVATTVHTLGAESLQYLGVSPQLSKVT